MLSAIDGDRLAKLMSALTDGHIHYALGAKAKHLNCLPAEIKAIDCSGFVRYLIHQLTGAILPDGSYHQHDWCKKQGLPKAKYSPDAGGQDQILRIAFITPSKHHPVGHVWLVLNGSTLESHGHTVGPDSRPWNTSVLRKHVGDCYELAYVLGPKNGLDSEGDQASIPQEVTGAF